MIKAILDGKRLYEIAKSHLGEHITMDEFVPHELGCAEAISYCLNEAGFKVPSNGFAGTAQLYDWLLANFEQVFEPKMGDVIISPTGTSSKGSAHGHCGINGKYGILANNSDSGLFAEIFTLTSWNKYYQDALGFPVYFFRP